MRLLPWASTFDTGIVIPGPASGETLRVVEADYVAFDRYPADGSAGTRVAAGQQHESFGMSIGGVNFGGLTTDVPNGPDEGAPDEFFSGLVTGSFGTGETAGGAVILRHSSLYGFTESPNSVNAAGVTIIIDRCRAVPDAVTTMPAETTTTVADTTTTVADTTTTVPDTTTTVADTTTTSGPAAPPAALDAEGPPLVAAEGPEIPPQVLGVSIRNTELPATGSGEGRLLALGSIALLLGTLLVMLRRRPAPHGPR